MENNIKLLIVKFKNQLTHDEVKYFRGAVIRNLSDKNVLFHNHEEEGLRYAYPLIQYKRMQNCAAIVCLNEGTEVIGNFFSTYQPHFMIGNHPVEMKIDKLNPVFSTIAQTDNQTMTYQLTRWLPLNGKTIPSITSWKELQSVCCFWKRYLWPISWPAPKACIFTWRNNWSAKYSTSKAAIR